RGQRQARGWAVDRPRLRARELQNEHIVRVEVTRESLSPSWREVKVRRDPALERRLQATTELRHGGPPPLDLVDDDGETACVGVMDVAQRGDRLILRGSDLEAIGGLLDQPDVLIERSDCVAET